MSLPASVELTLDQCKLLDRQTRELFRFALDMVDSSTSYQRYLEQRLSLPPVAFLFLARYCFSSVEADVAIPAILQHATSHGYRIVQCNWHGSPNIKSKTHCWYCH